MTNAKKLFIISSAFLAFSAGSACPADPSHGSVVFRLITSDKNNIQNDLVLLRSFDNKSDKISDLIEIFNEPDVPSQFKEKWWHNSIAGCAEFYSMGAFEAQGAQGQAVIRLPLLIERKSDGKIVGTLHLTEYPPDTIDIAYSVSPQYRRQGYALNAIRVGVSAIRRFDPHLKIVAWTDAENVSSRQLLEKAGFTHRLTDRRNLCAYLLRQDRSTLD